MTDPLARLPLSYKFAALFAAVCAVALGGGGLLVRRTVRTALADEIRAGVAAEAGAVSAALAARLRLYGSRMEDFASDGYVRDRLARRGDPAAKRELADHLRRNKLPLVGEFVGLAAVDEAGASVAAVGDSVVDGGAPAAVLPGERPVYGAVRFASRRDFADAFPVVVPVASLDGSRPVGRLAAWVAPSAWIAAAFREDGPEPPDAAGALVIRLSGPDRRRLGVVPDPQAPDGFRVEPDAPEAPADGSYASATRTVGATGWTVHVARETASALARGDAVVRRFALASFVVSAAALLLFWFPLRYVARPISRLSEAAARVGEGETAVRVPVETRDEIGRLAAAFNRMADAVARRTTDLATAAEEARAERARLSAVIAAMQDALVVSDATGKPVIANAAAAPLLGPAPDAVAPPDGLVPRGERLFEVRSAPLPGPHGEAAGRLVVARDVTERVAEDERRLHHDRLAVLGEAAAVMAHELNNPLAAMLMFNGMLEDELPPASPLREYAAVIRRNGESCKRSIRSLLDYATEAAAEATTLDLAAVLADVLRFLRPLAERSRFTFSLRVEAAETSLVGDETRLRQVFVNLLVNAVQAAGAEPGSAEIVVRAADDGLLVDVADDGPGIPQAARDAIFRPFFTTKPRGQGTGLGLPTALRIAELHGGGIELLPKGPPGATFRVRLARRYAGTA